MNTFAIGLGASAAVLALACSSAESAPPDDGPASSAVSTPPPAVVTTPVVTPTTGAIEVCGNGLDDNANGAADENCTCASGATRKCFTGAPPAAGVGACVMGTQTCIATGSNEFKANTWGPCTGSGASTTETSNGLDDNCNGKVDDVAGTDAGTTPVGPPCQGTGLMFASVGDECIDDGGGSATGDTLMVYCVNDIARFCLSGEACPWRDGQTTPDTVTCSNAGLSSTYFASARDTCGNWESHPRICCSASGQVSFSGC